MAYKTDEERKAAIADSRRRYLAKKKLERASQPKKPRKKGPDRTKEYWMHQAAKHRAKARGLEFDIEVSDIVIPEICPVLGIPLSLTNGKNVGSSPSLDRIDNNKGYIKGNIQVLSWRANKIKSDATLEELKALVSFLEGRP